MYKSNDVLYHNFDPQIIAPGHTVEVQFTFAPREPQDYCEIVEFELNGLSRQKVEICGTGTELKVGLAHHRSFSVPVKDYTRTSLYVVNNIFEIGMACTCIHVVTVCVCFMMC